MRVTSQKWLGNFVRLLGTWVLLQELQQKLLIVIEALLFDLYVFAGGLYFFERYLDHSDLALWREQSPWIVLQLGLLWKDEGFAFENLLLPQLGDVLKRTQVRFGNWWVGTLGDLFDDSLLLTMWSLWNGELIFFVFLNDVFPVIKFLSIHNLLI